MGILNVTPDSFADGGLYLDPGAAEAAARGDGGARRRHHRRRRRIHAARLRTISADEEIARIRPVIERLSRSLAIPDFDRHIEGRRRGSGARRRACDRQRRDWPGI